MSAKKKLLTWINQVIFLSILLGAVSLVSLSIGSSFIHPFKAAASLFGSENSIERTILLNIRLPRIILSIAVGGMLSLTGAVLQGLFRNPLVEPYTLGISGGAGLGVALGIIFHLQVFLGVFTLPLTGFGGAFAVMILLYILSIRKEGVKIRDILLTGVMISFITSSFIMLIMSLSDSEELHGIIFWIMGSLDEPVDFLIILAFVVSLLCLGFSCLFSKYLNAFLLGEEEAENLGINVENIKYLLFIVTSLMTGLCVSIAGIIGFVGLVVPHFIRMAIGRDYRIMLITSYLCGAIFLMCCDTIARVIIAPLELPVGVVTGIIGGIVFIYALTRKEVIL